MLKSTFLAALFVATSAQAETITKSFEAHAIKKVEFENASGKLNLKASADGTASVNADKRKFDKDCELKIEKSGETLVVTSKSKGALLSNPKCEVFFEISVPKDVTLDLKTGSGDIQIAGTKGKIDVKTGSGDIGIDGDIEDLKAKSGSGSVKAIGLLGDADVKVGSGSARLVYAKIPEKGGATVVTGSGNIDVTVPAGAKIKTDFTAGSGKVSNELGDAPDAKFSIRAKAGSGNLTIKKG